jgi:hypothetical protein
MRHCGPTLDAPTTASLKQHNYAVKDQGVSFAKQSAPVQSTDKLHSLTYHAPGHR